MNLYVINYQTNEEELCMLEMKSLFGFVPDKKYFFSDINIIAERSPFIKSVLKVMFEGDSLEKLTAGMTLNGVKYSGFKVKYVDAEGNMDFDEKHRIEGVIGDAILGKPRIHDNNVLLGVSRINGKWIFGEYTKNTGKWDVHTKKPNYYCNALSVRVAKSIVNISTGNNMNLKLVDPCCGIGTVLIEALSIGIDIEGFDINEKVVEGANDNLSFFGYPEVAAHMDIKDITKKYDVSIVDLPYGVLSIISREEQAEIIKNACRISDKLVLVSIESMDNEIKECGFKITDGCIIAKGKFKRYITVCSRC